MATKCSSFGIAFNLPPAKQKIVKAPQKIDIAKTFFYKMSKWDIYNGANEETRASFFLHCKKEKWFWLYCFSKW